MLREARRRAGYTQRGLARRLGAPQSQIARIESGGVVPRADTLDRLLAACGETLATEPVIGRGVDRSLIAEQLKLSPRRRLEDLARSAAAMDRVRGKARRAG